jgi:hypothetical protein
VEKAKAEAASPSPLKDARSSRQSRTSGAGTERTGTVGATTEAASVKQRKRTQNIVLARMTKLMKTLLYEMHSYSTPMAPFVKEVVEYVVRLYVGEEYQLGSDEVLRKTATTERALPDFLRTRSFFKKDSQLTESFKADPTDKHWYLEQKGKSFLDVSNHWSRELHSETSKIYRDAITESGMGQACYPVLNDYISNVSNGFEPSKIFSK